MHSYFNQKLHPKLVSLFILGRFSGMLYGLLRRFSIKKHAQEEEHINSNLNGFPACFMRKGTFY